MGRLASRSAPGDACWETSRRSVSSSRKDRSSRGDPACSRAPSWPPLYGRRTSASSRRRTRAARSRAGLTFLADPGGAARTRPQIVELRAPDSAPRHDLDALDTRGVDGEDALDADAVGGLAHGERLTVAAAAATEDGALEHLDALLVALHDAHVNSHGVARLERGHVLAQLLGLDPVYWVHRGLIGGEHAFLAVAAQAVKDDGRGRPHRQVIPPCRAEDRL